MAALPAPGSSAAAPCRSVARLWLSRPHALLPVTMPAHNGTSCVHAAGHLGGSALVTWRSCGLPRDSHAKSSSTSGRRLRLRPGRGGRLAAKAEAVRARREQALLLFEQQCQMTGAQQARSQLVASGGGRGAAAAEAHPDATTLASLRVVSVCFFVIKLSMYVSKCESARIEVFGPALSPQTSRQTAARTPRGLEGAR